MSNISNHKLELINSTLIPKCSNCLYSPDKNILIYSLSSNIVIYDLSNDSKKIINTKNKSKISNIKFLDKDKNILLLIYKSQFPIINILPLNEDKNIFSKIMPVEENFNISNIFVDRFRYNLFLILLSGINKNILYFFHLTNMKNNKYSLIPIGILQKLYIEITDFKSFYNTDLIICTTRNSLIYYKINLENQVCSLYKTIQLHLSIKSKSLKIDRKNGFISILTSKGECLIYDKEGNNIYNIKCPLSNNHEYFCFNLFSEFNNSLCLVTNKGNILLYDIEYQNYEEEYSFTIKKFIKNFNINLIIKEKYQFNKNDINNNNEDWVQDSKNNNIEIIYYNENSNLIMIYNNSLLSLSLSDIINKTFNKDSLLLSQFNHDQKINSGIIIYKASNNNNNLDYDNIIYTCSNNNILNSSYYIYSKNKCISYNYNFNYILPTKQVYITSIRFHPKYPKDILYLGDSKGFLYIIYKQRNFSYQKYDLNDINSDSDKNNYYDNPINLIMFSQSSEYIIYIGFNNGLQKLYDLKIDKNFNYYKLLSNNFLDNNEIIFRKNKSHVINFCYFFNYKNNLKDSFAYLANQQMVKISKFENENNLCITNSYNNDIISIKYNEPILDIKIHKSENYIITLNNKKQIIIKEINYGNIISILDFNKIMNYIYNFDLDISGLFLSLICDFKNNNQRKIYNINSNKSSIAIIEISSGKIVNYIKETNYTISKTKFDYYGRYLISLGEKGEITTWKLNTDINNIVTKAIENIQNNFYEFWENFDIKNGTENLYLDNNENIMDEMLTEELIDKEKYILDMDNYVNQEDFYRINNHGEKSIIENKSKTNSILINDNNSNSIYRSNMTQSFLNNNNINDISNSYNINEFNNNDYLFEEDHYINRNKYNYKNSTNYIRNNFNNTYNKKILETEIEKSNSNSLRKTSSFSNNNKNIPLKPKKDKIILSTNQKAESFRDMILKNKSRNKEKKVELDSDVKNIETPQFHVIQTHPMDKNDLGLFSFNSNNNDDKDIFELKKKIITQSSNLLYNQRRMVNLNNAMNKLKANNPFMINTHSNSIKSNKEEIAKENIFYNKDRYISLGKPEYQEENEKNILNKKNKKYPEPLDIDSNLINIDANLFKNDKNMIKLEKKDMSNENLFYINNKSGSNLINNNMNISNYSNSISLVREIQNNSNNSFLGKNNSKINSNINNNNFIENDISNNPNASIGDQISYLENNIKKFEKNFGK